MGTTPTISFYSNAFCTKYMHHITADSRYGARLVFSSLGVIGNYPCFWGTCMGNEGAFDRTHSSNHPSVVDCFLAGCASLYYTTCRVAREKRSYCRLENFSSVFRSYNVDCFKLGCTIRSCDGLFTSWCHSCFHGLENVERGPADKGFVNAYHGDVCYLPNIEMEKKAYVHDYAFDSNRMGRRPGCIDTWNLVESNIVSYCS